MAAELASVSSLAAAGRIAFQGERGAYSEAATWALVGEAARERVADKFSMDNMVKKTLKVYSEALACAQQ